MSIFLLLAARAALLISLCRVPAGLQVELVQSILHANVQHALTANSAAKYSL
jgi:hypothetical protein